MLLLELITIGLLFAIFLQDIKGRAVFWILFPLLAGALFALKLVTTRSIINCIWDTLINLGFLLVQLLLLSAYFSIKQKRRKLFHVNLIGIGDVLFLISAAFYPSLSSYLLFYVVSLVISLVAWLVWQALAERKSKAIPLAGLQALVFILFLSLDWWVKWIDLASDSWLINLIGK